MRRRLGLIDLDGVLCDDRHRVHHAEAREWGDYFALMHLDSVWPQGMALYENLTLCGFDEIAYCTGRREDTEIVTRRWLKEHGFDHRAPLIMRRMHDRRPLAEVKANNVADCASELYDEVWMFDDDPTVIEAVSKVDKGFGYHCRWHTKSSRLIRRGNT